VKRKSAKTNAVRLLEKHGIECELREYAVDEHDLSAAYVAQAIGLPPARVFKTLVVMGSSTGVFLACVPTDAELDLKKIARVSGNKKVEMAPVKEIPALTGYIRGGVSPVGTKKHYPVFMDESALTWPVISLSAGVRGCQMLVNPADLAKVVDVTHCSITKEKGV